MSKRKWRRITRCTRCGKLLDPNGKVRRFRCRDYCKMCFAHVAFKCQCCKRVWGISDKAACSDRICSRCGRLGGSVYMDWDAGKELIGTTFDAVKSKRRFGVEIETAQCKYVTRIKGKTPFGAKYDSTISGKEFDSPILSGDEGLIAIHSFCDMAKSRGWRVDEDCGTHVHLDMSYESAKSLASIAIGYLYTYPSWVKLVHPSRLNNVYCEAPTYCADVISKLTVESFTSNFVDIASRTSRYRFINIQAYMRHKTFEVRGLEGTLDKKLLTNWIIAHLTFADLCAKLSIEQVNELFNQPELICWANLKRLVLKNTARYFGRCRAKQTKSLHH